MQGGCGERTQVASTVLYWCCEGQGVMSALKMVSVELVGVC